MIRTWIGLQQTVANMQIVFRASTRRLLLYFDIAVIKIRKSG